MATIEVKELHDVLGYNADGSVKYGNMFYPVTHANAVIDNDGNTLGNVVTAYKETIEGEIDDVRKVVAALKMGKFFGFFAADTDLPISTEKGFAYVGTTAPFQVWQNDGNLWANSGATVSFSALADGEVSYDKLTAEVQAKLDALDSGGVVGDNITIAKNAVTNEMYLMPNSVGLSYLKTEVKDKFLTPDETTVYLNADGKLAVKDGSIETQHIKDGTILWSDLSQGVKDIINAGGGGGGGTGYNPDNVTISLNASSQLQVKDGSITDAKLAASAKTALLDSAALTGVPTAPTATSGTETTQIATTAFVMNAIKGIVTATGDITNYPDYTI